MTNFNSEQKNYIFEIYHFILNSKKYKLVTHFVKFFNDKYPDVHTSVNILKATASRLKVLSFFNEI